MNISLRLVPSIQCDTCGDMIPNATGLYEHCGSMYCRTCVTTASEGAECPICDTPLDSVADKMIDAANIDLHALQEG